MKNIKKSYFIIFGLIVLAIVCFSTSYAIFSNTKEEHGKLNIVAGNLNYKIESSELDSDSVTVTVPANTNKEIRIKLTSLNEVSSKYELYYILDKTNDKVSVGYSKDTKDSVLGTVEANKNKIITIVIRNDSDTSSKITFKVLGGLLNNELALKDGNSLNQELALCNYEKGYVWNFDYTGGEQEFTTPCSGSYKIELWGAQGGNFIVNSTSYSSTAYIGGYGGYSVGNIAMNKNENIFAFVGGQGGNANSLENNSGVRGYPNGGIVYSDKNSADINYSAGGGSSHISFEKKQISDMTSDKIILVAGGGGGANGWWGSSYGDNGGSGGGYIGSGTSKNFYGNGLGTNNSAGGTQTSGGQGGGNVGNDNYYNGGYGYGGPNFANNSVSGAGGGGYFGGGASWGGSGAGGSGYIGNPLLTNKTMYCYNCQESSEESTKTISTTCVSETPTSNCSKQGNGYARITYLGN